jgi:hypothetical protein
VRAPTTCSPLKNEVIATTTTAIITRFLGGATHRMLADHLY